MSGLPTDKVIFVTDEVQEPQNWPEQYGPWRPHRRIVCKVPSAHSSSVEHNVVICYIADIFDVDEDNIDNPLGFNLPGYRRIFAYGYFSKRCKIGMRNVGCCSHVAAVLMYLGVYSYDPDCFKNLYRPVHMFSVRNPPCLNQELLGATEDAQQNE